MACCLILLSFRKPTSDHDDLPTIFSVNKRTHFLALEVAMALPRGWGGLI
jgi:hypothetical protein